MVKWLKSLKNQRGMTLIELMGVVIILGIVATVATAAVINASDKAKVSTDTSSVSVIKDAVQRYLMDTPTTTVSTDPVNPTVIDATNLTAGGYLREVPSDSGDKTLDKVKVHTASGALVWDFTVSGDTGAGTFAKKAKNRE